MTVKPQKPLTDDGHPMLKMKQLMDATGLPKSTLLLYVKKGLLPPPLKTSPNMAYYHPACVERIGFIKEIQARHRLPLAAIKGLLKEMDKGEDIAPLLELQSHLFGGDSEKMDRNAFCKATGLTFSLLDTLCEMGLILPLESHVFDRRDVEMGRLLARMADQGMDMEELAFYPRLAKEIVDHELRLRETHTRGLDFSENAGRTLEMTRMARGLRAYVIDRVLQKRLIHYKGLKPE